MIDNKLDLEEKIDKVNEKQVKDCKKVYTENDKNLNNRIRNSLHNLDD